MKYQLPLFIFILLLIGCNGETYESSLYNTIPVSSVSGNVRFNSLELEKVNFDKIQSSYNAVLFVRNDTLIFFDTSFSRAFLFNREGHFIEKRLGVGPGPNEIPNRTMSFIDQQQNGSLVLVGNSNDFHIIDSDFIRAKSSVIRWQSNKPLEFLRNNPTPTDHRAYDLAYNMGNMKVMENYAYLPLASAPPPFSKYNLTTDLFAHEARIAAKMNLETGEVEEIIGRLSPTYHRNENARIFSFYKMTADIKNRLFYVTFRPDSLIYVKDHNFMPIRAFGLRGRNMNTNYELFPNTNNTETLSLHWQKEIQEKGYYSGIYFEPALDMVFRTYTKGNEEKYDGLQIYRDEKLLADVDVPEGFMVSGFSDPYVYSSVFVNQDMEELHIFRFNIHDFIDNE